ncbi:SAM-dependent methyltransferase [Actinomadura roseirufa]|uniref:SAM-dependent methyltransferase n=1 Tax=Actinomadura roseirufa TaxID=2094049 RepID=UPI00104137E9|nr:class I SAM-dependent methyltransferase [Actinomadura roseirufa]
MTSQSATPATAGQMSDYYSGMGALLQMAWGDNFHFGYWDGPSDTNTIEQATDRFTDILTERLRLSPGDRVLDLGCGVGKPALRIASTTGASVVGVTINARHVELATERARAEGKADQVTFRHGDAMDLPFADGSFDAVLLFESIIHMDRPTVLREVQRVLVPGGRLALTDLTPLTGEDDTPESFRSMIGADPEDGAPDIATLINAEAWPGLLADANMLLDEVTDVTENTNGTWVRLFENFFKVRREFEAKHGITVEQVLDSAKSGAPTVGVGCLVIAGHKP